MRIDIFRKYRKEEAVFGRLRIYDDARNLLFSCHTLENIPRDTKVAGVTGIPAGSYSVRLMKYNTPMNLNYKNRFPEIHNGMLELQDVPDFSQIYIHIGNYLKDTDGCILVGNSVQISKNMITESTNAYLEIYRILLEPLLKGEEVECEIWEGVL